MKAATSLRFLLAATIISASTVQCFKSGVTGVPMQASVTGPDEVEATTTSNSLRNSCQVDDDCVQIEADCCGCNSGGADTAINKKYLAAFKQKQAVDCKDTVCPAVYECPGQSATAVCNGGRCELKWHSGIKDKP